MVQHIPRLNGWKRPGGDQLASRNAEIDEGGEVKFPGFVHTALDWPLTQWAESAGSNARGPQGASGNDRSAAFAGCNADRLVDPVRWVTTLAGYVVTLNRRGARTARGGRRHVPGVMNVLRRLQAGESALLAGSVPWFSPFHLLLHFSWLGR